MKDKLSSPSIVETTTALLNTKTQEAETIIAGYMLDESHIKTELNFATQTAQEVGAGGVIQNLIDSAREHGDLNPESSFHIGRFLALITALEAQFMPVIEGIERVFPHETALDIIASAEFQVAYQALKDAQELGKGAVSDPGEAAYIAEHMQTGLFCNALRHEILSLKNTLVIQKRNTPPTKRIYTV